MTQNNKLSWDEFMVGNYEPRALDQNLKFLENTSIHPVIDLISEFIGYAPYIWGDVEEAVEKNAIWYVNNYEYENENDKIFDDEYLQFQFPEEEENDDEFSW